MSAFVPPNYSDVVKPLNDLLNKDYPVGSSKLELNTTAPNGVKFTVTGTKDNKTAVISSEMKAKYANKKRGLTLTETWNTANVLGAVVELKDTLVQGLTLNLNGHLHPSVGKKNAKAGFEYKQANVFTRSSVDLFKGPTLNADAVVGTEAVVAGADVSYDVTDAKLTKFNSLLAHSTKDYTMAATASNMFGHFSFAYFHKVQPGLEAGGKCQWNKATDSSVSLEVGTKYVMDKDASLKAKINNSGIRYSQMLRTGVKLQLGGQFDTTRLGEAAHKVGFSLAFEG